jgi:hypothetical protein
MPRLTEWNPPLWIAPGRTARTGAIKSEWRKRRVGKAKDLPP